MNWVMFRVFAAECPLGCSLYSYGGHDVSHVAFQVRCRLYEKDYMAQLDNSAKYDAARSHRILQSISFTIG